MIKKVLKENLIYIILLISLVVSFVILFNSVFCKHIIDIDSKVIFIFNDIISDILTKFFVFMTYFGDVLIPIFIILCVYLYKNNKLYTILLSISYLLSGILAYITKMIIARPRPTFALINIPKSYSFPSGHTLTSLVLYFTLWYLLTLKSTKSKKIIWFILTSLLVICIGTSRIYLKVHFFSDVVGGAISGILLLTIVINIIRKNFKEKL